MQALNQGQTVAIIGAGTMGIGIAQVAAEAGHPVILYDLDQAVISKNLDALRRRLHSQVERGKRTEADRQALLERISTTTELADLAPAALVVEAIVEKLEIKQQLFADLELICADRTILATNTSSLSITAIGAALDQPQRLAGMHFFNPAPVLPLVEIVSGLATDQGVAETLYATARAWGKSPVFARSTPGFIVNRVARPFYAEGLRLLEEGAADVATIDGVIRDCGGFRMGPFELMDLIGHDVNYAVTESVFSAYFQDPRFKPSLVQQELVSAGFLGRKSGRGFYDYRHQDERIIATLAPAAPPRELTAVGEAGWLATLVEQAKAAGIAVDTQPLAGAGDCPHALVDGVRLMLTQGLTATEQAARLGQHQLVLMDLCLDFSQARRVNIAVAQQAGESAVASVAGLFQALGKPVTQIQDLPGMIVMRTVCMLANEAADAVHHGVTSVDDVDVAMCQGVNYPRGPLQWADELGVPQVFTVLENLQASYGEDRYRPSLLLRRHCFAGRSFYGQPFRRRNA